MVSTDLVISINIYKNVLNLRKQLDIVDKYVDCSYIVILNCNDSMMDSIKDERFQPNIIINPEIINNKNQLGLLCKGIVSNMSYALNNISFKYFLIISARTIFYRTLHLEYLDKMNKSWKSLDERDMIRKSPFNETGWGWPKFMQTDLGKYYLSKGYRLEASAHEGLCFNKDVIINIVRFLKKNEIIENNIYTIICSEEFALTTIAMNEADPVNLSYGYLYLGNGVYESWDPNDQAKYTRKIKFDSWS